MSMTDYEIAVNAGRTILCSLEADGRLRFLSQSQRDVAVMMQDFFANRALELRAAEKEAETPPTDLDERFGLEALAAHQALLRDANVRIKALGKLVDTVSMEGARKRADLHFKINRLEEANAKIEQRERYAEDKFDLVADEITWIKERVEQLKEANATKVDWDQQAIEACTGMEDPKPMVRTLVQFARLHNVCGYSKNVDPYA